MAISNAITLSEEVLRQIDHLLDQTISRSEFIEKILRQYLFERASQTREFQDLDILNRHADVLNQEAEDVLAYQVNL